MSPQRTRDEDEDLAKTPKADVDPAGQSPDAPIEFNRDDAVGRGNEERANAEPEPAALHDAQVPGKPDVAQRRRDIERDAAKDDKK